MAIMIFSLGLSVKYIQEVFFVWAPANLIYHFSSPEVHFGAEVLNYDTYQDIKMNRSIEKKSSLFFL
jgi:hypothetical protein